MKNLTIAGQVYRCAVCGAEVSVIRSGKGNLTPHCCNQPMLLQASLNPIYSCPVCGAEVMVTRKGKGALTPRCCNRFMELIAQRIV
jgi:desulfoferrodoxin-like iron-binding protein